ncbi:hypothetical protein [Mycolicibacterium palauense]|uniref:hypothetical protein n=1 Tax=Mycolicibacterium palauense TaxID=2034511 RepID=UPI000BFF12FB|nr:hypothetical protein [Mycolicibacterium palauense]
MHARLRQRLLRINAIFLGGFGLLGLAVLDVPAACCRTGAAATIVGGAPSSAIGFIEAHGLAVILAALLFHASLRVPDRSWHVAASATHLLLGTANIVFRDLFVIGDVVWVGWLTTVLHFVFAIAETVAAVTVSARGVPGPVNQAD